jgi:CubicO group peptidase (beta-lactamase class C family)
MFTPLGINDTAFKIGPSQRARLVGMHARGADGTLAPMAFEIPQDPEFHMGGGGLYGTAPDYIAFIRMLLNNGSLNGNRVLKPETVAMMAQNHIGNLNVGKLPTAMPPLSNEVELYPEQDKKWGLSFLINTQRTAEGRSAGRAKHIPNGECRVVKSVWGHMAPMNPTDTPAIDSALFELLAD